MTKNKKDKLIYDVKLEDWQEGVFATSLVKNPAIMSDFVFYSDTEEQVNPIILFASEDKKEVVGAIMIPDLLMPRKDPDGNVFYVRFSKDVIYSLNERMKEYGYDKSFTFAHSYSAAGKVKLLESWIKEFDEDKSNGYGFDLPVGTLFMKVKVEEDILWSLIKEKKLKGFSIELNASYELSNKLNKNENMSKQDLFERKLTVDKFNFVWDGDESITADTILLQAETLTDEAGVVTEKIHAFTGEFEIDNNVYNVANGIVNIKEKEVPVVEVPKQAEVAVVGAFDTDGFLLKITDLLDAKIQSLKDEFSVSNKAVENSLEEVKLFQKQNITKEQKEFSGAPTEMSTRERIEVLNKFKKK